jgi:hypothetical protein
MLKIDLNTLAFVREDIHRLLRSLNIDTTREIHETKRKILGGVPAGVLQRGSFIEWFKIFVFNVDQSLSGGQVKLHAESIKLLDVYHDLRATKHLSGWSRLIGVVADGAKAGSLVDELACLKDLMQGNGVVEICNEDGRSHRKTADFLIRNKKGTYQC